MFKLHPNRSGKIKTRIFALVLMIFSCSILISGYRSINREFAGVLIRKTAAAGIASTQYQLHLLPMTGDFNTELLNKAITDLNYPLQRVGVSALAYEQAQSLESVEKKSMALTITVDDGTFIDLGFSWILAGIAGIIISIWMYLQTLKPKISGASEEIDVPGLI